jgi:hypothetical protein
LRLNLWNIACGIDHADTLWLACRRRQVTVAHAFEKIGFFALESVGHATLTGASQPLLHRNIEQQGEIWTQTLLHPIFQSANAGLRYTAPTPLVSVGGIGEAVAHHTGALGECRADHARQVLGARGEHQQQLGINLHALSTMQQ